jgi:peptide/nickel transport system ATP-binding protein
VTPQPTERPTGQSTGQPAGGTAPSGDIVLEVRDLRVHFPTNDGVVKAVDGLDFTLARGKTLGIVGESGSGKSVSSSAIMGLHNPQRTKISGSITLNGVDLLTLSEDQMRKRRGRDVAMIFQDPLSSMHPYYTVGNQIVEAYRVHNDVSKKQARERAIEMLARVGIPQPDRRVDDYPHQFSGGMRQRAMIAMGLINDPGLLIADEPTTALDVTVQAQILDLLQDLQREFDSAVIIITHDLGVVAEMADDVLVMYAGRGVEYGPCKEILTHPEMPYTWGLLSSVPDVQGDTAVKLVPIPGNPPSLLSPPSGCKFHPRCQHRDKVPGDLCRTEEPLLAPGQRGPGHTKRCHIANPEDIYAKEVLPEVEGVPEAMRDLVEESK